MLAQICNSLELKSINFYAQIHQNPPESRLIFTLLVRKEPKTGAC